jgi:hypothetical protein
LSTVDRGSPGRRALLAIGIPLLLFLIFAGVTIARGAELPVTHDGRQPAPLTTGSGDDGRAAAPAAEKEVSGTDSNAPLFVLGIGFFLVIGLGSAYLFFRKPNHDRDADLELDDDGQDTPAS